eukprot:863691-Pleurochrysis_carterae.AAC.1
MPALRLSGPTNQASPRQEAKRANQQVCAARPLDAVRYCNLYNLYADMQKRALMRAWLLKHGYYLGKTSVVRHSFFHHFFSCLRWPAGRADRAGLQQAAFSMELPSMEPLRDLLGQCEYHKGAK